MLSRPVPSPGADHFGVLEGFAATEPWLDHVSRASDAHGNELGFFARKVFEQFARRGGLYVLIDQSAKPAVYVGHLLFDLRYPRAHVRQMFTLAEYRRRGAASALLNQLRASLTQGGYISIYARVAEDLREANAFWHGQRFYVQRSVLGGATKNRQILVRCHELESPQLFPPSGLNEHNPLGLLTASTSDLPMFLLDMNVLFDAQPRRLRRSEVVGLFQAERMGFCRLAISDEVRQELQRTALQGKTTDPMGAYIDTFPCVPVGQNADSICAQLAAIVFPEAANGNVLTARQTSDLRHIAAVIANDLGGLITADEALLRAAPAIEEKFGVQIVSSGYFLADEATRTDDFESITKETLRLCTVSSDVDAAVRAMLSEGVQISGSEIASRWLSIDSQNRVAIRCAAWAGSKCIGYITWPARTPIGAVVVRAALDESHAQALDAARTLLLYLLERLTGEGPRQVRLELPAHQSNLREVAVGLGFAGSPKESYLVKSILGRVLTRTNWAAGHELLTSVGGPKLPAQIPTFRCVEQQLALLTPEGNKVHIPLDRLESLLSPALLCLPGRPAVICPVRRQYGEPLLGYSPQTSLLPQLTASLFTERLYVGDPKTLRHVRRGTLVLFYESSKAKGRSEVVSLARVREAYLKPTDSFGANDLKNSVLTTKHLPKIGKSEMKAAIVFDNIFTLPNAVGLATLKRLGCGRPNDLITTKPISDQQLQAILEEAFSAN